MTKARDIASAAPAPSTVSATELGYLDGVTSSVQTQLDGKQAANAAVSTTELGYLDGVTSAIQTQIDGKSSTAHTHSGVYVANLAFNAQTGTTYTLVVGDKDKLVTASNASAITVTVPPSVYSAGDQIHVQQIGAGQVTFAAGAGVTITSTGATAAAPKLRVQYSACTVICSASNTFTIVGDIA